MVVESLVIFNLHLTQLLVSDYRVETIVWLLLIKILIVGLDSDVGVGEGIETEVCGLGVIFLEIVYLWEAG